MSAQGPDHIHVVIMGGTIDSDIDRFGETRVSLKSRVVRYIESAILPYFSISQEIICLKDSREIDDSDRDNMAAAIKASHKKYFIVTHGTFTLCDTAKYLAELYGNEGYAGKTIIFVGAFFPLYLPESDAPFNMGFAIGAINLLPPGVYVAMNGRIFPSGTVVKQSNQGRFVAT